MLWNKLHFANQMRDLGAKGDSISSRKALGGTITLNITMMRIKKMRRSNSPHFFFSYSFKAFMALG